MEAILQNQTNFCLWGVFWKGISVTGCGVSFILWGYQKHSHFQPLLGKGDMIYGCFLERKAFSRVKRSSAPLCLL